MFTEKNNKGEVHNNEAWPKSWSTSPSTEMAKLTIAILAVVSGAKCGFFSLVVMYIRKSFEYSMVDSPNLMQTDPPC